MIGRRPYHTRLVIAAWAADHHTEHPQSALDYLTSADYTRTMTSAIARPAAQNKSFARRAMAYPAPIGIKTNRVPVAAGPKACGKSQAANKSYAVAGIEEGVSALLRHQPSVSSFAQVEPDELDQSLDWLGCACGLPQ